MAALLTVENLEHNRHSPSPSRGLPAIAIQEDVEADAYLQDSAYQSEVDSFTTSLASSAVNYRYENGRRYHAHRDGGYIYPNDEPETERLDAVHKMIEISMENRLYWAPIKDPKRVLDIGTGTGIWAIEFADKFPQAEVLGNDISPIQPRWVPPNVTFEVDDVEQPWVYSRPFDFIHSRCMGNAIKDWPKLLQQTFSSLAPGCYAEFVDLDVHYLSPDGTLKPDSDLYKLNLNFLETTRRAGIEPSPGPLIAGWMEEAGFVDIVACRRFLPLGTWPADRHLKEVGAWNLMIIHDFIDGLLNYLYRKMQGWSEEECQTAYAKIRRELRNPHVHSMYSLWIVYGKRPDAPLEE